MFHVLYHILLGSSGTRAKPTPFVGEHATTPLCPSGLPPLPLLPVDEPMIPLLCCDRPSSRDRHFCKSRRRTPQPQRPHPKSHLGAHHRAYVHVVANSEHLVALSPWPHRAQPYHHPDARRDAARQTLDPAPHHARHLTGVSCATRGCEHGHSQILVH